VYLEDPNRGFLNFYKYCFVGVVVEGLDFCEFGGF